MVIFIYVYLNFYIFVHYFVYFCIKVKNKAKLNINTRFPYHIYMKDKAFASSVNYYCTTVFDSCISHMFDGEIYGMNNNPLPKGPPYENPYYSGFLMLKDGATILKKAAKILRRDGGVEGETKVESLEDMVSYLNFYSEHSDKKFLYDSHAKKMYRVSGGEFNNNYPGSENIDINEMLKEALPEDYCAKDCSIPVTKVGTKTMISVLVPRYDIRGDNGEYLGEVESVTLSQTPVGAGFGRLSRIDRKGVVEDFHIDYDKKTACWKGTYRQRNEDGNLEVKKDLEVELLNKRLADLSNKPAFYMTPLIESQEALQKYIA